MTIAVQLLLIVGSVAGLLVAMACVHMLGKRFNWSAELQRKCVHVTTGLYALTLPLTFDRAWPVLLLCSLSILVMGILRLPLFATSRIGSTIHSVERKSYGELFLALSVGFLFFRSIDEPVLFVLPILVLTFADAGAALTGVHYGRRFFAVENGSKSIEGVTIFFLVTFIIAMICLLLMTDIAKISVILTALVVAAFGAQLEADSWRGFDNLFVPVGLHLFLQNNMNLPPAGLLASAILFLGILVGLLLAAPRLGMTRHAARGYSVLAFLILSVTAPHNGVLPLAAFVFYLLLRKTKPCRSQYPDLDFLAACAGVAALWLFVGEFGGHNAINLYNLTFAGVASIFAVLLLAPRFAVLGLALAVAFGLAVLTISNFNTPESRWMAAFAVSIAASLILCSALACLWPGLFLRYRAPRAFALALAVPATIYALKSLTTWT